jgi:predicted CopG family antitoxin
LEGWKTIQVEAKTWNKLCELKKFPEKASFNEVIKWLIEEQKKSETNNG